MHIVAVYKIMAGTGKSEWLQEEYKERKEAEISRRQ